jgi:drug/metabolite transporter (DMT)-like permease
MIEQPSLALPARRTTLLPLALLIILGSSWGLHFPILKFAARSGLPYSGIAAAIICGVALALLTISLARGRLPVFRPRTVRFYFVCAILGYLVPYFLALFATGRIDADMVTLITSTSPVITLCLAAVAGIERVSALRILGIGLGLVSVLFLIVPQIDRVDKAALTAMILAFGVPVSYSSYHVYLSKRWPAGFDSFQVACGEALVALGLMLPLFLATGGTAILHSDWTAAHWAILALIAITTIDCYLYFEIVRLAGPVFVSQANFITVTAGVFWAMLLHGERPSGWLWVSLAFLVASLSLLVVGRRTRTRTVPVVRIEHP